MKKSMFIVIVLLVTLFATISCNQKPINEVQIGNQIWMTKNLDVDTFKNGDQLYAALSYEEWVYAIKNQIPAWCFYNFNPENGVLFGRLYNWYAVNDDRGLCSDGWHVPSDEEWTILEDFLGGKKIAGDKLKSIDLWANNDNGISGNGSNESGFDGKPGGVLEEGKSKYKGERGYWWSSTQNDNYQSWYRYLNYNNGDIKRYTHGKSVGMSVRCIRNY